MACSCGFTTNTDNTCNGNHKVVKLIKDKIILNINKAAESEDNEINSSVLEKIVKIVKETK